MPTAREPTPTGPALSPRRALRTATVGLACAVGAMGAHVAAGGEVPTAAGLVAVGASVALAPVLLGARTDPARTLALSLVAQVLWHATFLVSATLSGVAMTHHGDAVSMACAHVLAAAVAAVVAVGAERAATSAADWLVGVLLPALVRAVPHPVPRRPAPAYAALQLLPDLDAHDPARPLRAPPVGAPPD